MPRQFERTHEVTHPWLVSLHTYHTRDEIECPHPYRDIIILETVEYEILVFGNHAWVLLHQLVETEETEIFH